jgi:serine/threonine protein kinase/Leucine-rich repeat (LRR) protein
MAKPIICPSDSEIQQLLRAECPPEQLESFAEHLERCSRCGDALDRLLAGDTLLEAARAQSTAVAYGNPYVQSLLSRINQVLRGEPAASTSIVAHRSDKATPVSGRDPFEEVADEFLARCRAGERPSVAEYAERHPALAEQIRDLFPGLLLMEKYRPAAQSQAAGAGREQIALDFLAPAQAPGELGRLGVYRIIEVLGSGGMGIVFEAEDTHLGRTVALKVMKPQAAAMPGARQRFLREARAAATLEHENVVTIYQVGEEGGVPFLAMQRLRGISLEERLHAGRLDVAELLRLGIQIARGLAAAHARGLIHRDIKPSNIWLESNETAEEVNGLGAARVKILDFGLVRAVEDDARLTARGAIVGTPTYMAPEQAEGQAVDHRSDLFSLGVVLYRMATGTTPFRGRSVLAALASLASDHPRPPGEFNPDLQPALTSLIMQLLSKDPAKRPASAREVGDRLQAIAASRESGRSRSKWRRRAFVAALLLAGSIPLAYLCGGPIVRYATKKGVLVVQLDDPTVQVTVKQDGLVVQDRTTQREFVLNAGDGLVDVFEPGSGLKIGTQRFTLTRGGKETIAVQLEKAAPKAIAGPATKSVATADPDRQAAEWVLSLGGSVGIDTNGKREEVSTLEGLPSGAFRITSIGITPKGPLGDDEFSQLERLASLTGLALMGPQVNDAVLPRLKRLSHLRLLNLGQTEVSDAGLLHLKALPNLDDLNLRRTRITDAGLRHLEGFTHLGRLVIAETRVSDDGMAHLKPLTKLWALHVSNTQVTDAGLAHLEGLTNLLDLSVGGTKITDNGLAIIERFTKLQYLGLNSTSITNAGLARVKNLSKLKSLSIARTKISDAGLAHLGALSGFTYLDLTDTRVTDASLDRILNWHQLNELRVERTRISARGCATLRKAFPKATIRWSEPNYSAAQAVFALGGAVQVRVDGANADRSIRKAVALPAGYFRVKKAHLGGTRQPLQDALRLLTALADPEFDQLDSLDLSGTMVTAADIEELRKLPRLADLALAHTELGDESLPALSALRCVRRLILDNTKIVGFRLAALGRLPELSELALGCPSLEYFKQINELKTLERLSLAGTGITDADLPALYGLSGLKELDLTGTQVTMPGLDALQKALPGCKIRSSAATK